MKFQPIDQFATTLAPEKRQSVYGGTKATHEKRTKLLAAQFAEPDHLRRILDAGRRSGSSCPWPRNASRQAGRRSTGRSTPRRRAARCSPSCSAAAPRGSSRQRLW